jgi:hypothetical protein
MPLSYDTLLTSYPVGARVVGLAEKSSSSTPDAPMVVETITGGFVATMPDHIARTADGDLDFARFNPSQNWSFVDFEFEKAVLARRSARQAQRFRRLLNIARYDGFYRYSDLSWLDAR